MQPSSIWPIYIPSKQRPNGSTLALLRRDGIPATVVLEPEDVADYVGKADSELVLPESNQGLGYARWFINRHAMQMSFSTPWMWVLDDDISSLYRAVPTPKGRRMRRAPTSDVLLEAQQVLTALTARARNVAIAGLEYRYAAWRNSHPLYFDYHVGSAVAVNVGLLNRVGVNYDRNLPLFEDADFVCNVVSHNLRTVKFGWLAFADPQNGSKLGGCHSWWHTPPSEQLDVRLAKRVTKRYLPDTPDNQAYVIKTIGIAAPNIPLVKLGATRAKDEYPFPRPEWMDAVVE